ncbi:helix-turn-helix domain-containing protein [Pseudolysinimonas sp.]|uniref:helix-turn-helix domain-containing protein n=1 Tax=Pseudolysinimonas sp. TaxID=2680009 RepID=UPI003F7F523F
MTILDAAGAVRRARRLPQSVVAKRSGEAVPNLSSIENGRRTPRADKLDRILRASDARLVVAPTTRVSALETSTEIRKALRSGDSRQAFRAWLAFGDALAAENAVNRVVLAAFPPEPTGSEVFDAALASLAELRLHEVNGPVPEWASDAPALDDETVLADSPYVRSVDPADIPDEFRRRRVLIAGDTLASV